jgi:hypothetical protein
MSIEGTGSSREAYIHEYRQGVDLFQRALKESVTADNIYKKEELKEVMDETMGVLNETVSALKSKELADMNSQIAKDYEAYQKSGDPTALQSDLKTAYNLVRHD